jgi:Domain of unknown function (DUF4845)
MYNSKQRGITLIGWLFLLVPLAIVVYAAIRLTPIYLNYMKVARTVDQVAEELGDAGSLNDRTIRRALEKRLDIESVSYPDVKDLGVRRDGQTWIIEAKYEDIAPLFANLSLLLQFDKSKSIE